MSKGTNIKTLETSVISERDVQSGQIKTIDRLNFKPKKSYHWIGNESLNSGNRWNNLRVLRLRHRQQEAFLPPLPYNLILVYQGAPSRQHTILEGKNLHFLQTKGSVTVTPALQTMRSWYDDAEQDDIYLHLTPDFLQKTALEIDLNPEKAQLIDVFCTNAPQIERIAFLALDELQRGGAGGQLYADSLATALAIQLLRSFSADNFQPKNFQSGLPPLKLRRVIEFINENLGEDLSLAEIAEVIGMGEFHFLRQFKKSTGQTPHQYLMMQRLERAKDLLRQTVLTNTEIAYMLGFSSPSHFASLFHREIGVTPNGYRQHIL